MTFEGVLHNIATILTFRIKINIIVIYRNEFGFIAHSIEIIINDIKTNCHENHFRQTDTISGFLSKRTNAKTPKTAIIARYPLSNPNILPTLYKKKKRNNNEKLIIVKTFSNIINR